MNVVRSQTFLWLLPLLGAASVLLNSYRKKRVHGLPLPPGPGFWHAAKGLVTMDSSAPWLLFTEWHKQYGPLVYMDIAQPLLITNSESIARELLEKRSSKYSSRPEAPSFDLYGWGWTTVVLPYNDRWRQHRRFYMHGFRPDVAVQWRPFQIQNARALLLNLLTSPMDHEQHVATFTASTVLSVTYGYNAASHDDPLVELVNQAMVLLMKGNEFSKVIFFTMFPFLQYLPTWLPGLGFFRDAQASRKFSRLMLDAPFEHVKKSMVCRTNLLTAFCINMIYLKADGKAQISLVSEILSRLEEDGGPYEGEETASYLMTFLLAMTMDHSIQERAQAEIDTVVGKGRLPDFDDRPSLPYVEALLRELMRWHQVIPFGIGHAVTEDDVYDGVFIPKSMLTIPWSWAIAHDESKYPDPHTFNPSRFLTPEGKLNDDDMYIIFGFGRRICPGRHLAVASLWAAIVSILAAFDIRKAKDEKGNDIEIVPIFAPGASSYVSVFVHCSSVSEHRLG
ncbi:hypothetical protein HYDPIDRAFT_97981 [Hydnomerulius pinastri MD-312]|uniref:Cytochrome P450 n=1 Tax=Hydnomerulius pinastri MD-312 TaxID=994086 RepID=A0A0C9WB13_9AGAM|nr:hypothetical protein HYDPIDRAFT_97981 [Hydnomerulius pinastri MD-312]